MCHEGGRRSMGVKDGERRGAGSKMAREWGRGGARIRKLWG